MARPRIAVVSPFIDKRHGTERRVAEFISRLADRYEFHIYSMQVKDIDLTRAVWQRIPRLPGPYLLTYLWWFLANQLWRWRDRSRGIVPDLIYSPGINCLDADAVSVHILFGSFRKSATNDLRLTHNSIFAWPRVVHRGLFYRLIAALEPHVYGRAGLCIATVSQKTAADLKRTYPGLGDVTVVYNGLDLECFSPQRRACLRSAARSALSVQNNQFALLLIGNDWRNKGLFCLLSAMAVLDTNVCALIVGSDSPTPFRPLIQRLGVEGRVQFCPPRADVETYYAAADAYVGASLNDAFAQPPAEAMACGLPVITSRQNGGSEIITHGCDGLILENPTDSTSLADMIRNLIADEALRSRLGAAARETARRYTWERNAAQMHDFFQTALRQKSQR